MRDVVDPAGSKRSASRSDLASGFAPECAGVPRETVNPVAVPLLEVHLLERDEPLYGRCLRVSFLKKLRDEARFDGLAPLREAIAQDARDARDFFAKHG